MLDLLYTHPSGHFEREQGSEVILARNGQVLLADPGGSKTVRLEWSGVEAMLSSLISGSEATDVEIVAQDYGRLEVYAGERLIADDAGFSLGPAALYGGLSLIDAAGDERVVLRAGNWWLPGEQVGDLHVRAIAIGVTLPQIVAPGPRSRVSNLAERRF